jgi:hypothetical protein
MFKMMLESTELRKGHTEDGLGELFHLEVKLGIVVIVIV